MNARDQIARLVALVTEARSMPMSSSAVVNRSEVLDLLAALDETVVTELSEARTVLDSREDLVAEARREAEQILAEARLEQERLVSDTDVFRLAQRQAEETLAAARTETEALRQETDEYVDGRLAGLQITLEKTLAAVQRGRDTLAGRSDLDGLADGENDLRLPDHFHE